MQAIAVEHFNPRQELTGKEDAFLNPSIPSHTPAAAEQESSRQRIAKQRTKERQQSRRLKRSLCN